MMTKLFIKNYNELEQELINFRHDLHQNPELGFQETKTAKKIANELKKLGIKVYENVGKTGVIGVLKKGNSSKSILLRADMDALPIEENSQFSYSSRNKGIMHACGHDGHSTMLLGGAKILASQNEFDGTAYFLFQPNEENGLGAKEIINSDIFKKLSIDEAYSIHNLPGESLGNISSRVGNICASETLFEITIDGKGSHASMPHKGVDTIYVGSEIVLSLQSIVSRKLNPNSGAVFSVTEFVTNGSRNILPGKTTLKGDFRTHNFLDRNLIEKLINQICNGIASSHNVKIGINVRSEFVETVNSQEQCNAAIEIGNDLGLKTDSDREKLPFSEDFAHFTAIIPGCLILLGNGKDDSHGQPLHSSNYDFNDKNLIIGAKFWSSLVLKRLKKI